MKDKTLILTGWGLPDYAAAGAAALRAFPSADVRGVSQRHLPEFLAAGSGYGKIFILGVGIAGTADEIGRVVARLAADGTSTTWISVLDLPPEAAPLAAGTPLRLAIDRAASTVTEAVGRLFAVAVDDLLPFTVKSADRKSAVFLYQELFQAAGYAHRVQGADWAYARAMRHLAARDSPSAWDRLAGVVDDFRKYGSRELIGNSAAMQAVRAQIARAAKFPRTRVMILGDSGTGKETVAQQIHNQGPRKGEVFLAFNCASVSPNLLESRLFGHEKGAFTGADRRTRGLFESARGGTLFLDEIGELPLEAQGLLLRVLQENRFQRVGGTESVEADARLIVATNRDLARHVRENRFRLDLFERLCVLQIRLPALNEHKEDIPDIADNWWIRNTGVRLTDRQKADLMSFDYVGNVRELLNLLERAMILEEPDFRHVLADYRAMNGGLFDDAPGDRPGYPENLEAMTRCHVQTVARRYPTKREAARALGISPNTLKKYL
ncbi:MAG: sigma 54-interacting transcriptional regulator [Kiritimatiellia bacterium]